MGYEKLSDYIYDVLGKLPPYKKMLDEVYNELNIQFGSVILDAGCGVGNLCQLISNNERVNTIIGIDNSNSMIMKAKTKLEYKLNVILKEADLNYKLNFNDSTFDGIALLNVLYLLNNPQSTLMELYRLLKPGGRLVIVNPIEADSIYDILSRYGGIEYNKISSKTKLFINLLTSKVINKIIAPTAKQQQFNFIKQEQFENMLKHYNFNKISMRLTNNDQSLLVVAIK